MIRRLRTLTIWTGSILSLLSAAAFVASGWWLLAVRVTPTDGPVLSVSSGMCVVCLGRQGERGWAARPTTPRYDPGSFVQRWPNWAYWNKWTRRGRFIYVPIYAVFAAVAIPTLLVWRLWPRPVDPGCCRCGYDLTDNTSGTCPECGLTTIMDRD